MKKFSFFGLILALVGISLVSYYNGNTTSIVTSNTKNQPNHEELDFQFPIGTTFKENIDSEGNIESYDFTLPSNSKMIGISSKNEIIDGLAGGSGTLRCTCSGDGACKPFTAGGKWGCVLDGCTNCKESVSKLKDSDAFDLFFLVQGEASVFFLLAALGIGSPIFQVDDWLSIPFIETKDFDNPDFQKVFTEIDDYIKSESKDLSTIVSIPYYIDGKKMLIDIPYDLVEDGMLYTLAAGNSGSSIACSGTCKSGKCVKKTAAFGQVTYCDGCDSGCSLTL